MRVWPEFREWLLGEPSSNVFEDPDLHLFYSMSSDLLYGWPSIWGRTRTPPRYSKTRTITLETSYYSGRSLFRIGCYRSAREGYVQYVNERLPRVGANGSQVREDMIELPLPTDEDMIPAPLPPGMMPIAKPEPFVALVKLMVIAGRISYV